MSPPAVPRPARAGRLPRWLPQHAACRVGAGRVVGSAPVGAAPQKPRHPTPALPRHARRGRGASPAAHARLRSIPSTLHPVAGPARPLHPRCGPASRWLSMRTSTRSPSARRGHQHAVARVAFAAKARACVVQQGARPCAPARHCPGQCRAPATQTGPAQAWAPASTAKAPAAAQTTSATAMAGAWPASRRPTRPAPSPQRCCGQNTTAQGQLASHCRPAARAAKPTPPATTTAPTPPRPAPGRDHQRDPRYGQQVGRKPHQRHLAKQQQAQRRERQRHHHCSRNNA